MKYLNSPHLLLSLLAIFIMPTFATAHKINVFAYESGNTIYCEANFSGGRAAKNTTIQVTDEDSHQLMLTGTTNELGKFDFPIQEEMRNNNTNLIIIAESGDGHKNTWQLPAEDYLYSVKNEQITTPAPPPPHETTTLTKNTNQSIDQQAIEKMIEKVIQRELAPVKRSLAQQVSTGPNAKDVFSGLGYIFGLAGLIVLIRSKKKGTKNE